MSEAKAEGGSGTSTAPVYLRLQQRAEAESKRPRTSKESAWMRGASIVFLVLVCLSCLVWLVALYVDSNPRFELRFVELRSGKYVAASKVEAVFQADRDKSIYQVPLEERRQEVERIPWVQAATVTRILPDRISVAVHEREPVAYLWTRRGVLLIDGEGVILDTPEESSWTFPVLRGVSDREPVERRKERMQRFLALADALRTDAGAFPQEISEVDLANPQNVVVVVADSAGALKLHLGTEEFGERYETYRSHIEDWRQQFAEIQSVDLRYEGQAVIQAGSPTTLPLEKKAGARLRPDKQTEQQSERRNPQPAAPSSPEELASAASF